MEATIAWGLYSGYIGDNGKWKLTFCCVTPTAYPGNAWPCGGVMFAPRCAQLALDTTTTSFRAFQVSTILGQAPSGKVSPRNGDHIRSALVSPLGGSSDPVGTIADIQNTIAAVLTTYKLDIAFRPDTYNADFALRINIPVPES